MPLLLSEESKSMQIGSVQQVFSALGDRFICISFTVPCLLVRPNFLERKTSSQKLFVDLNSSKGSNCLRFVCWSSYNTQLRVRVAQSKTCWWVELWI